MYTEIVLRQRQDKGARARKTATGAERKRLESCAECELKAMQRLSARLAYLTTRAVSGDLMAGKKDSTFPTIDSVA